MMSKRTRPLKMACLPLAAALFLVAPPLHAVMEEFDFTVYLDKKEIGRQTFTLTDNGEGRMVRIEADFDVKILFFSAYRYQHTNVEVWEEGCLQSISSSTTDGGDEFFVSGTKKGDQLEVTNREGTETYEGCVRSYVYWDPSLLAGTKLLNSQTGKLDKVAIEDLGEQTIDVRGVPAKTACRRIVGDKFTIVLWYAGDEWVALESTTSSGDRLYYAIR